MLVIQYMNLLLILNYSLQIFSIIFQMLHPILLKQQQKKIRKEPIFDEFQEFDNPIRYKLNSKFLQTKYRASIGDLNHTQQKYGLARVSLNENIMNQGVKNNNLRKKFAMRSSVGCQNIKKEIQDLKNKQSMQNDLIMRKEGNASEDYRIIQKIGEGSFGRVYQAEDIYSKKKVAIKTISIKKFTDDSEIQILSKCNHPHILRIQKVYQGIKNIEIVMEYCKGGSLLKFMRKIQSSQQRLSVLSQNIVKNISKQILEGLKHIHSQLIVHGDLKLQNVCFKDQITNLKSIKNSSIAIIDFGLAKKTQYKVVKKNSIGGTKAYQSPESVKGWLSDKTDIWSCGIIIYALLSGKFPFPRKKAKNFDYQQLHKDPPTFSGPQWDLISAEAKQLVKNMFQINFRKRPNAQQCLKFKWFQQKKSKIKMINVNQSQF